MTRVCAWCHTWMGEKAPLEDRRITHGICPRCNAVQITSLHAQMQELAAAHNAPSSRSPQDESVRSNSTVPVS
jgi:hypothetical protein